MDSQWFDLGDILSVLTGRLVAPRGMDGLYDMLSHMTGASIFTHQIPKAITACRTSLAAAYPALDAASQAALPRLDAHLAGTTNATDREAIVRTWVKSLADEHGWTLEAACIPHLTSAFDTPVADAIELWGPENVLLVEPTEKP